jgi:SAM-dependent methyltransferase
MSKAVKRLYRLTNTVCSDRVSFAAASIADSLLSWGRPAALAIAESNYDLGESYPRLSARPSLSPTPLCMSMSRNGSDKGMRRHNYTQLYDAIFSTRRQAIKRLFEIGIGTNNVALKSHMGRLGRPGASLRGWLEYFPAAHVFAADVDRDILFSTPRIKTFFCDQTDPHAIEALWANADLAEPFDIIIDDGLHEFRANALFFEKSFFKLRPGGMFFVEDVIQGELRLWRDFLAKFAHSGSQPRWAVIRLHHPFNKVDNNIVFVENTPAAAKQPGS